MRFSPHAYVTVACLVGLFCSSCGDPRPKAEPQLIESGFWLVNETRETLDVAKALDGAVGEWITVVGAPKTGGTRVAMVVPDARTHVLVVLVDQRGLSDAPFQRALLMATGILAKRGAGDYALSRTTYTWIDRPRPEAVPRLIETSFLIRGVPPDMDVTRDLAESAGMWISVAGIPHAVGDRAAIIVHDRRTEIVVFLTDERLVPHAPSPGAVALVTGYLTRDAEEYGLVPMAYEWLEL